MVGTIYSIIPAILMLVLVLLTRRVLLSLGAGIIVGALFIHDFAIWPSIKEIWSVFYEIFISDGSLNVGNLLRSEEHTSELQSRFDLVCRLLLEKKNVRQNKDMQYTKCTRIIKDRTSTIFRQ